MLSSYAVLFYGTKILNPDMYKKYLDNSDDFEKATEDYGIDIWGVGPDYNVLYLIIEQSKHEIDEDTKVWIHRLKDCGVCTIYNINTLNGLQSIMEYSWESQLMEVSLKLGFDVEEPDWHWGFNIN